MPKTSLAERTSKASRQLPPRLGRKTSLPTLALTVLTAILIYPLVDAIIASFKQPNGNLSTSAWTGLFRAAPFAPEMGRSLLITGFSVLGVLLIAAPAGYAFSKLPIFGSNVIFWLIVGCMMAPIESFIVPEYTDFIKFGLVNSYVGTVIVYVGLGVPFAVFLFGRYFRGLPDAIIEAAAMDGCSALGIFIRIALPLAIPAFITVGVLEFLSVWNDLLVALLFLPAGSHTVTVGLASLQVLRVNDTSTMVAGSVVSVIPPVVVWLVFERYLVAGLTAGATRG